MVSMLSFVACEEPTPEPEPTPGEFTPGAQLDLLDAADVLPGTWTWEASTDGHFGCGDAIANPCGWWNGTANCKCKDNAGSCSCGNHAAPAAEGDALVSEITKKVLAALGR